MIPVSEDRRGSAAPARSGVPSAVRRVVGVAHALAAAVAAGMLLIGAFVAFGNLRRIAENEERVVHSHDVLDAFSAVGTTLTIAEADARGYLIGGNADELATYRHAVDGIAAQMALLRKLVIDEPVQRARVPALRRLVQGRLEQLERTVALRHEDFEAARREVADDLGRATMNAIRDEIAAGTRLERLLLAQRQRESTRSFRVAISNGILVVAIALLMGIALSVFVRRDLRARALIAARLAEADRRKDEFLATLAHELRNPLAPLRTAVETLRISGDRRQAAKQAQQIIQRQVRTMSRLVDDLLDLGRIARGVVDLRKETLDLVALVRQTAEACAPQAQARRHEVRLALPEKPLHVSADPTRLTQIFTNLLMNAIKYTPEGGHISVSVQATQSRAVVRVRDNGVGIPAAMLPRIFDMYTQVETAPERSQGGLGIGLSVARRLLSMQDATIEAKSAGPGTGSEFTVRFPRVPAPAGVQAPARHAPVLLRFPRRILVVDDNTDAAESLCGFLGMLGHEVRVAHDGPSALEMLASFSPEIVLLDIGLPGMSGWDVAKRIREDPAHANVVLVAQTGWAREEDRVRSVEAGFDHHLAKPLDPRALESLIGSLPS